MAYAVENALFQWRDAEQRLRETHEPQRARLERAVFAVVDELRRRLGSRFLIEELAGLYAESGDWAAELAAAHAPVTDAALVADAAFARYAQEASDYAGGRTRETHARPG